MVQVFLDVFSHIKEIPYNTHEDPPLLSLVLDYPVPYLPVRA